MGMNSIFFLWFFFFILIRNDALAAWYLCTSLMNIWYLVIWLGNVMYSNTFITNSQSYKTEWKFGTVIFSLF